MAYIDSYPRCLGEANTQVVLVGELNPVELLPNTGRRAKIIIQNSAGVLYVKLGANASSSNFTYRLNSNAVLETEHYHGVVTGIRQSGIGTVLVTEL